jgi:MFS family permease
MSSWRVAFLMTGLPGVLLAFLVFAVPEPRRPKSSKNDGGPERLGQVLARKRLLLTTFFLAFPAIAICPVTLMAWGPTFLIRHHGWEPQEVGLAFGVIAGVFGTAGNLLSGVLVDFAYRHGVRDAHFRIPLIALVVAIPVVATGLLTDSPMLSVMMFGLAFGLFTTYAGPSASALQIVAPDHLRGQISAIFIVLVSIIGTGVGPVAVGLVTDLVLRDEAKLGGSMIIVFTLAAAFAVSLLSVTLGRLRAEMGAGDGGGEPLGVTALAGGEEGARI